MPKEMSISLDVRALRELERRLPGKADEIVGKIALDLEADIKSNFSRVSPSAPGDPPGIDTGLLKNSIQARRKRPMLWIVQAGTEYAAALEFGYPARNLAARPFIRPAIKRIAPRIPARFKAVVK